MTHERHRWWFTIWILVVCGVAAPGGQHDGPFSVLHPSDFHDSAAVSERVLNERAGRGYRLLSLRDVQVWEPVAVAHAPEYRVVLAPHSPAWWTRSTEREAKGRLRDAVNRLAREGFRVHPEAHSPGAGTFWRGGERGAAIVMERVPGRRTACRYEVVGVEDDTPIALPSDARPLALRVWRGVVTESCAPPTGRRDGLTLRWVDHRKARQLGALLSTMANDGCRFLVDNADAGAIGRPQLGTLFACAADDATTREFRVLVPRGRSGPIGVPAEAAAQAMLQRDLNAAGADGFCLVGSASVQFVLERTAARNERCEYRLVLAEDARLVSIVDQGLAAGFRPAVQVEWADGMVLERRRLSPN